MADLKRFILEGKTITYIRSFIELYHWKNHGQVHEIYGTIEIEEMYTLTTKNLRNLGAHRIIEISSVLQSAHMIPRNLDMFVFYVNNYID